MFWQDLVEVLADGQWWLHKEGWNCEGGDLNSYYNHPVCAYHDVSCFCCTWPCNAWQLLLCTVLSTNLHSQNMGRDCPHSCSKAALLDPGDAGNAM